MGPNKQYDCIYVEEGPGVTKSCTPVFTSNDHYYSSYLERGDTYSMTKCPPATSTNHYDRSDNFTEAENGGVEESIEAPSTPTTLVVHSLPLTTESRISKSLSLAVHNEPIFREHVESNDDFPHLRTHFQLMAVSILMILIGMVLIVTVLVMVSHPIG